MGKSISFNDFSTPEMPTYFNYYLCVCVCVCVCNALATEIYSLEWVPLAGFLHGAHDVAVDAEAEGDGEHGEGQVGEHAEQRAAGQRQQHEQHAAEHHPRPAHITPVDQVQH